MKFQLNNLMVVTIFNWKKRRNLQKSVLQHWIKFYKGNSLNFFPGDSGLFCAILQPGYIETLCCRYFTKAMSTQVFQLNFSLISGKSNWQVFERFKLNYISSPYHFYYIILQSKLFIIPIGTTHSYKNFCRQENCQSYKI